MLQSIRNKASSWFVLVLIFIVLFAMLFLGVGDYLTTRVDTYVAKVGDEEIDQNTYRQRFSEWRQMMRQQLGANYDPRVFEQPGFKRQLLDRLVDETLLRQANERMDLVVPPNRLRAEIMTAPAFQVGGQFNPETYRNFLAARGTTAEAFDNDLRDSLAAQLLPQAVRESALVGKAQVDAYLRLSEQTRDFRFLRISEPAEAVDETVADEDVQSYYDEHKDQFLSPETVTVQYVEIDAASVPVPTEPSEGDLKDRYENEKNRFGTPEQRLASHILVRPEGDDADAQRAALTKAEALVTKARAEGADFAALASENSDDLGSREQGGDLGWIELGLTEPAFEEALFALEPGAISDPVRTDEGYHIIQLRELREATIKSFEDVRAELEAEYVRAERERLYNDRAGELIDLVYQEPGSLEPTAQALGLEIKTAGPFSRNSGQGPFADPVAREKAFSDEVLVEGIVSDPLEIGEDRMIAMRLLEHTPSAPRPMEEVADDIRTRVLAQRRADALKSRADALYERISNGETLDAIAEDLGVEVETAEAVGRNAAAPERALVNEAFKMPRPKGDTPARDLVQVAGAYAIVELTRVTDGNPSEVAEARREQVRNELQQSDAMAEMQGLIEVLRKETAITVAEDRLQ